MLLIRDTLQAPALLKASLIGDKTVEQKDLNSPPLTKTQKSQPLLYNYRPFSG